MIRFILLFLFSFIIISYGIPCPACWNFPQPSINCSTSGPYIDGPFAFVTSDNNELGFWGKYIANIMEGFDVANWNGTQTIGNYHISINYLYCLPANYTDKVKDLLKQFRWNSFNVYVDHVCCATDGSWQAQLCVDDFGQKVLTNFSDQIRYFLNKYDVPLENHNTWQPYYHNTIGWVTTKYDFVKFFNKSIVPEIDIQVKLDKFVFQETTYYSDDYIEPKSNGNSTLTDIIILLVIIIIFVIIIVICCLLNYLGEVKVRKVLNRKKIREKNSIEYGQLNNE